MAHKLVQSEMGCPRVLSSREATLRLVAKTVHIQQLEVHLELLFFFFQAEDGIRDVAVTGVQTCALPISERAHPPRSAFRIVGGPILPYWQGLFRAERDTRIFFDGAVLPVHDGRARRNHSRRDSSSAVAASVRRCGACP